MTPPPVKKHFSTSRSTDRWGSSSHHFSMDVKVRWGKSKWCTDTIACQSWIKSMILWMFHLHWRCIKFRTSMCRKSGNAAWRIDDWTSWAGNRSGSTRVSPGPAQQVQYSQWHIWLLNSLENRKGNQWRFSSACPESWFKNIRLAFVLRRSSQVMPPRARRQVGIIRRDWSLVSLVKQMIQEWFWSIKEWTWSLGIRMVECSIIGWMEISNSGPLWCWWIAANNQYLALELAGF